MTDMRAKFQVVRIEPLTLNDGKQNASEKIEFIPVTGTEPYGANGESEDNTYARYTPAGKLTLTITNPDLVGQFRVGQKFYADFTEADANEETAKEKADRERIEGNEKAAGAKGAGAEA